LSFESLFDLVIFALESLIKILNSDFEVAHGLEEDGISSLIGPLRKLPDVHLKLKKF